MSLRTFLLLTSLIGASAAQAQQDKPVTVIHAGRLWDAEKGRMTPAQDVVIRGDRVVAVGRDLPVPPDATVVDARGCSVLPGLIDTHTHILLEQRFGEQLSASVVRERAGSGDVGRVMAAVPRVRAYLDAGFTTIRDLGNSGSFLDLMLKQAIGYSQVAGPRIFGSGPGLAPAGGQLEPMASDPDHLIDSEYRIIKGVDDARAAVRDAIARGADVIKIYPEASPQRTKLSIAEIRSIVEEATRHGIPVAAHATSDASIREAVEAGVRSIEHGYVVSEATLRLMKERGVWLVPTDPSIDMALEFTKSWKRQPPREEVDAQLKIFRDRLTMARRIGVRVALGSDLYFTFAAGRGAGSRGTIEGYVEAGLTPSEALRSATWEAGRLLGDDGLGVLRPGAHADVIAVGGDPAADIKALRDIRYVMKNGLTAVAFRGCSEQKQPVP